MTEPHQNYGPWENPQGLGTEGTQPGAGYSQGQQPYQYPQGSQPQGPHQYPQNSQPQQPPMNQPQQAQLGGWGGVPQSTPYGGPGTGMNASVSTGPKLPGDPKTWTYAGIGGALLAFIGSFGPWATISGLLSLSISGTAGAGVITLFLALIGGAMLAAGMFLGGAVRTCAAPVAIAAGGITFAVASLNLINLGRGIDSTDRSFGVGLASVSVGWGIVAVIIGGAVLAAAGILLLSAKKQPKVH